jgi:hypothetical protein
VGIVNVSRIDRSGGFGKPMLRFFPRVAHAARGGDFAHQAVQADGVGRDRRVALIGNNFPVNERKGAQRRHCFVEPNAGARAEA